MGNHSEPAAVSVLADPTGGRGAVGGVSGGDLVEFGCMVESMRIDPHAPDTVVVLRLAGEIDLATQPALETSVHSGLHAGARHLLVDLSAVVFCGARGLGTLVDTARAATDQEIGYGLCGLPPHVNRTVATLWGCGGPTRHRSLAAAVTTIRAAHVRRSLTPDVPG